MYKVKVASGNSPGEEMTGKLKQASDIFFCEKGGNLTCCFSNVQCLEDWHELNDKVKQALFWQRTKKIKIENEFKLSINICFTKKHQSNCQFFKII